MAFSSSNPLDRLEVVCRVAALTVVAEIPPVDIITAMTTATGIADFNITGNRARVAGLAPEIEVCTVDLEACLQGVVELPARPVGRNVAKTAIGAEFPLVGVIIKMTIDTGFGRIPESGGFMTIAAHRVFVRSDKRKDRQPVIEQHIFCPAGLVVALATSFAELVLVRIIVLVARIAIRFEKDFMDRLDVAVSADEIGMPAEQRKIRFNLMLE
jgi:hypothetical protein